MAHILSPQPTWPCLINGFERGHTQRLVQHAVDVPRHINIIATFSFCLCEDDFIQYFFDTMQYLTVGLDHI